MTAPKRNSKNANASYQAWRKKKLENRPEMLSLLDIAEGVTARVGETFFSSLVTHLAQALKADISLVGELVRPASACVRTISVYRDGQVVDNFEYELKGTPCETVIGREICSYDHVQERFPQDIMLVKRGIQGYVGAPLFDASGQALGIIVVLFRQPVKDVATAESLLRIFAARASAELMRIQAEKAFRESELRFRNTLENVNLVAVTLDVRGRITFCNDFLLNLTGWQAGEVIGKSWFEIFTPFDARIPEMFYPNLILGKIPAHFENEIQTRQGKRRLIDWNNTILRDADGAVIGTASIGRDVTEQRQAEALAQSQLRRLNALHRMELVISSSFDLRFTLSVLVGQAIEQLGVNAAAILLYNPVTQVLEFGAGQGFLFSRIEQARLQPGDGHAGRALLERRTVRFPDQDATQTAPFTELMQQEGFAAYFGTPLIAKGQVKGVLEVYHRRPLEPDREWLEFLETLATQTAIAIDNAELFDGLQRLNSELSLAYEATLEGWVRALNLRAHEMHDHAVNTIDLTLYLAHSLGVSGEALGHIRRGALLHDVGKCAVPEAILLKPGPLDEDEWALVRRHPLTAYELLSRIAYLCPALDIPYCHHEKWDGAGYPRQLKGQEIPLAARIFSVVEAWDVLQRDRPYCKAWDAQRALDYIHAQRGLHFDPQVVDAFVAIVSEKK